MSSLLVIAVVKLAVMTCVAALSLAVVAMLVIVGPYGACMQQDQSSGRSWDALAG